jgi:hypothetical protein
MQELEQSSEPLADFGKALDDARTTGDFDFVLDTAKKSHQMLLDFRDAVQDADFKGRQSAPVAQGLNFIDNMINQANQASSQLEALKRASKAARSEAKVSTHVQ